MLLSRHFWQGFVLALIAVRVAEHFMSREQTWVEIQEPPTRYRRVVKHIARRLGR